MLQTDHIFMVFRVLEKPREIIFEDEFAIFFFRVKSTYFDSNIITTLILYGQESELVFEQYKLNDFVFVEGSLMWFLANLYSNLPNLSISVSKIT